MTQVPDFVPDALITQALNDAVTATTPDGFTPETYLDAWLAALCMALRELTQLLHPLPPGIHVTSLTPTLDPPGARIEVTGGHVLRVTVHHVAGPLFDATFT